MGQPLYEMSRKLATVKAVHRLHLEYQTSSDIPNVKINVKISYSQTDIVTSDVRHRLHLEYGVSVWSPHHEYLVEKLEKVQKELQN